MKAFGQLVFMLSASALGLYYLGRSTYWTVAVVAAIVVGVVAFLKYIRHENATPLIQLVASFFVAALAGCFWPGLPIALTWGSVARRQEAQRTDDPNNDEAS